MDKLPSRFLTNISLLIMGNNILVINSSSS
jgi:hypothetical protein